MKITANELKKRKTAGPAIVMLTSYDFPSAHFEDECGIDVQLVGDSVGTNVLGYDDVSQVSVEDMLHHVKAVGRGAKRSFVICDMPFGSFKTCEEALKNARLFIEAGADGIKMEGEQESIAQLACVASAGIPVCGHIGYTPQTDGAKAAVQGKDLQRAQELLSIAKEIEKAGAFMLVLELIPEQLAKKITRHVKIPTIGIGAGRFCDGQVQVVYDIAGMSERLFRHSKVFGDMASEFRKVLNSYTEEVRRGTFPAEKNSSKLPENIQDELEDWLKSLQKT